jgi:hypothetical protein
MEIHSRAAFTYHERSRHLYLSISGNQHAHPELGIHADHWSPQPLTRSGSALLQHPWKTTKIRTFPTYAGHGDYGASAFLILQSS